MLVCVVIVVVIIAVEKKKKKKKKKKRGWYVCDFYGLTLKFQEHPSPPQKTSCESNFFFPFCDDVEKRVQTRVR